MRVRPMRTNDQETVDAIDTTFVCAARAQLWIEGRTIRWHPEPIAPFEKRYDVTALGPIEHALVATDDDGAVLGVASTAFQPWNRRCTLQGIYVDRDRRRHGVGRCLIDACLERAAKAHSRHLWLETQDNNCDAIAFYERLGFSIVGLDRSLYAEPHLEEVAVFMARDVRFDAAQSVASA